MKDCQFLSSSDALAKTKIEVEASVNDESPLHIDSEWNISVVDDEDNTKTSASKSSDALLEGLIHKLPNADKLQDPSLVEGISTITDDLEELQRQLDTLNSS